ncbi:MAG: sulfotransferase domain-containing protein [Leptolyngbya sp. SIO4C1]|nr:sulfotransferase domain-containing protein [Leptolyngbya sp. SIO4C1]
MAMLPNFVIIGAMKCATTTLHEQLEAQPGIFMSEPKEPNFFSDDDQYQRGLAWYRSLFAAAKSEDLCGESSTHYTKLPTYPSTVQRLQQHLPEVKVIYVMRHPIDRLISQYIHEWSQKVISGSLAQAVKQHPELVAYSSYSRQLRPYLETFGPDRVLPVFVEQLKQQPQAEFERICQFIGYPGSPTWLSDLKHQHASSERLRKSAWRDTIVNAPVLSQIRRYWVPQSVRDRIKGFWQMRQRPQLSEHDYSWLAAQLDEDLAILGRWLGLELSCQTFATAVLTPDLSWADDLAVELPKPLPVS